MAAFPLFIDLTGKKCVIVGGGRVAERRIEVLLSFGANILVISPSITDAIRALKETQALTHWERIYSEGDLKEAFLVVAATSDKEVNLSVAEEARKYNLFVNVADNPKRSTFLFPALVKKDNLVVGITTTGSYPLLTGFIRQKIEKLLSAFNGQELTTLKACREWAKAKIQNAETRKEVLYRVMERTLLREDVLGTPRREDILEQILKEVEHETYHQDRNQRESIGSGTESLGSPGNQEKIPRL